MGAGLVDARYVPGDGPLHRLPPQCKVVALLAFVLAVASTPREAFWAFGLHALAVAAVARLGGLRVATVVRRLSIELPFLAFAVLLPLVGGGERTEVLGLSLSSAGLWAAWNVVAKGTLGVAAGIVVAATTAVPQLLHGLERLHLPRRFVAVAGFMVRYLDLTAGEAQRMAVARRSRGHDPRWLGQAQAVAATAGTLFIRSYERGERVHLAMRSRGYDGTLPDLDQPAPTGRDWLGALALPVAAAFVALAAWTALR